MLYYIDEGFTIKNAFDGATFLYDGVAPYAKFAGDTWQTVTTGITGRVWMPTYYGNIPLQGAKVEVYQTGQYAFTDHEGYYEIFPPHGSYTLTASYPTLKDKTYDDVQVVRGQFTQRNFVLEQENPGLPIPL